MASDDIKKEGKFILSNASWEQYNCKKNDTRTSLMGSLKGVLGVEWPCETLVWQQDDENAFKILGVIWQHCSYTMRYCHDN